jgi:DNA-binding GntR family transcriptional regulator
VKQSVFSGVADEVISKQPLAEKVFIFLEEGILSMKYAPGTVLNEYEVATHLGISRSPVREAILRLEQVGLVNKDGKKRIVSIITMDDINNNYELWEMAEPFCAARTCLTASPEQIKTIQSILKDMDECQSKKQLEMYRDLNLKFHKSLIVPCKNRLMVDYHNLVMNRIRWGSNYSISVTNESGHSSVSHHEIFLAYSKKEQTKVERLLRTHIREAADRILQKFQAIQQSKVS